MPHFLICMTILAFVAIVMIKLLTQSYKGWEDIHDDKN